MGSLPAENPVVEMYKINGLYYYAASCCVDPNPHSAVLTSSSQLTCGPCPTILPPTSTLSIQQPTGASGTALPNEVSVKNSAHADSWSVDWEDSVTVQHVAQCQLVQDSSSSDQGLQDFLAQDLDAGQVYYDCYEVSLDVSVGNVNQTISWTYLMYFPIEELDGVATDVSVSDYSLNSSSSHRVGWITTVENGQATNSLITWRAPSTFSL